MSEHDDRIAKTLSKHLGTAAGVEQLADRECLKRCMNGLRELVPEESRRIDLLQAAAEEGVPGEVLAAHGNTAALERLTQRFGTTRHLTSEAAHWTVNTWEQALKNSNEPLVPIEIEYEPLPLDWYLAPKAKGRWKRVAARLGLFLLCVVIFCLAVSFFLTRSH